MPDPIGPQLDPTLPPEITNEENEARMSLVSAHPEVSASSAPPIPPPPAPAVNALVTRFTPARATPTPEPSLLHALANCKLSAFSYVANTGAALLAAPDSFGLSFAFGAARITATSITLGNCIQQDEASQVATATRENAANACRAEGATPLTGADGAVICAK